MEWLPTCPWLLPVLHLGLFGGNNADSPLESRLRGGSELGGGYRGGILSTPFLCYGVSYTSPFRMLARVYDNGTLVSSAELGFAIHFIHTRTWPTL